MNIYVHLVCLSFATAAATNPTTLIFLERSAPKNFLILPMMPGHTLQDFTVCYRFWEKRCIGNQFLRVQDKIKDDSTMSSLLSNATSTSAASAGGGDFNPFIDMSRGEIIGLVGSIYSLIQIS